jgi:hypothetical protein
MPQMEMTCMEMKRLMCWAISSQQFMNGILMKYIVSNNRFTFTLPAWMGTHSFPCRRENEFE